MPNTYTQICIHITFGTKRREKTILQPYREELYKYITGIISNRGHKLLAIGGTSDHIHIFIGMKPHTALSDLVRDIKHFSTKFINEKKFIPGQFQWQEGFGAFSYSDSQLPSVINYIKKQEEHHKVESYNEEYEALLNQFKVDFNPEYTHEKE